MLRRRGVSLSYNPRKFSSRADQKRGAPQWFKNHTSLRTTFVGAGQIRRRLALDLVGLTQLAAKLGQFFLFFTRRTGAQAVVALGLSCPVAKRLARTTDRRDNRLDHPSLQSVLAAVIQNHPNRTLANFGTIRRCTLRQGSDLSRVGASEKVGAVQGLRDRYRCKRLSGVRRSGRSPRVKASRDPALAAPLARKSKPGRTSDDPSSLSKPTADLETSAATSPVEIVRYYSEVPSPKPAAGLTCSR